MCPQHTYTTLSQYLIVLAKTKPSMDFDECHTCYFSGSSLALLVALDKNVLYFILVESMLVFSKVVSFVFNDAAKEGKYTTGLTSKVNPHSHCVSSTQN